MKNKLIISIFILSLAFLLIPNVSADSPITGTAYGMNIGLIHFDYITAMNPYDECVDPLDSSPSTLNCPLHAEYANYHIGPRNDFYISHMSADLDLFNPDYDSGYTSGIGDAGTCTASHCFLNGYSWSDEIGWIIMSGQDIQNAMSPSDFPQDDFAKISISDGAFSGFIWSEKTGWIKLSNPGFNSSAVQTATNWGLWLDITSDIEPPEQSDECATMDETTCNDNSHICSWFSGTCEAKSINKGRPIKGFAWSEKLGWIKFNSEGEFFSGTYTTWIPDNTPPVHHVKDGDVESGGNYEDNIWFANNDIAGMFIWENFASDEESSINLDETEFYIKSDDPACGIAIDDTDTLALHTFRQLDTNNYRLMFNAGLLGLVDASAPGYCKYTLEAKITNGAGLTFYIDDDTDSTIEVPGGYNTADPLQYREELTFFVRAGDYDNAVIDAVTGGSCVDPSSGTDAVADGVDCYEYAFSPMDIAGNPIAPVMVARDGTDLSVAPSDTWMREINSKFAFASQMEFDQVKTDAPTGNHVTPIKLDNNEGITQNAFNDFEYVTELLSTTKTYPAKIRTYAPTTIDGYLSIFSATANIRDAEMPEISEHNSPTTAVDAYDEVFTPGTAISLVYSGAVQSSGDITNATVLVPSVPVTAKFEIANISNTVNIDKIAIDSRIYFENESDSAGFGMEVLDIRDIAGTEGITEDTPLVVGRSDPMSTKNRYLVMTSYNDNINNIFHTSAENIHINSYPFNFGLDVDLNVVPSDITTNGSYEVDGIFDLTKEEKEKLNDDPPFVYENFYIDRNDKFTSDMLNSSNNKTFSYTLTPNQYMGATPTDNVSFSVDQYIAYDVSPTSIGLYTIYEQEDVIDGMDFQNIGLQASGKVSGQNIYDVTGRDLDVLSPTDSSELKRLIRNNVADITRNMNLETCSGGDVGILPTTASECVVIDEINKTIIAVYTSSVTLTGNITVPSDYSYTLLLRDGADLTIKGNILPGDSIAFGIIALADEDGDGGNVYITPTPTDIHTLLYAEGSIISVDDTGNSCYGSGSCDLKNQLYWKGSIVSRNTIGGAPTGTLPPGITKADDCSGLSTTECAQKYDMDYLRRFVLTAYKDGGSTIGHYADNDAKYSGDNSCTTAAPPVCSFDNETTMTSTSTPSLIDIEQSKSYDPVFVEKDNKPAPPGFSTSVGFSRSQTIR